MFRWTNVGCRKGMATAAAAQAWHIGRSRLICRQVTEPRRWKLSRIASMSTTRYSGSSTERSGRTCEREKAAQTAGTHSRVTPITRAQNHETHECETMNNSLTRRREAPEDEAYMPDTVYPSNTRELAQKRRELSPDTEAAFQVFSQKVFTDGALPRLSRSSPSRWHTLPNALIVSRGTRRRRYGMAPHKKS